MNPGGNPYGWGVFGIPMARQPLGKTPGASSGNRVLDLCRNLLRDPLGQVLLFGFPLLCLALLFLSLLGNRLPETLPPPERAPVEITVNLRHKARELPPPVALAPPPAASPDMPLGRVKTEPAPKTPPVPSTPPTTRAAAEPKRLVRSPSPGPQAAPAFSKTGPRELSLPSPSPVEPLRIGGRTERPSLPERRDLGLKSARDAVLPIDPSTSSFASARRPDVPVLPENKAAFGITEHQAELPVRPAKNRNPIRTFSRSETPPEEGVVLNRQGGADLNLPDNGISGVRHPSSRAAAGPAELPPPRQTMVAGRGGETPVIPPSTAASRTGRMHQAAVDALPSGPGDGLSFDSSGPGVALAPPPSTSGPTGGGRERPEKTALPAGGNPVSFARAGKEQDPGLPAARVASAAVSTQTFGRPDAVPGRSYDFLDQMSPAELDRSVLTHLNLLRTCLDPGAEMNLKARLAGLLSRPALCRSQGVVFDVGSPESAYSIQVDLYNYEKRIFPDRCAALKSALEACEARRLYR